jgi:gas vesicle protein
VLSYVAVAAGAAAVGAAAGVLLAPASGRDTRRRIARHLEEERAALKERAREVVDRLAAHATDGIEAGKEKLDELLHH